MLIVPVAGTAPPPIRPQPGQDQYYGYRKGAVHLTGRIIQREALQGFELTIPNQTCRIHHKKVLRTYIF
jgi:hypothetical protein